MCGYLILSFTQGLFYFAIIAAICIGIGFGFTIPLTNHLTVEKSDSQNRGKNLAYFSMFTFLGQFVSSLLEGSISEMRSMYFVIALIALIIVMGSSVLKKLKSPVQSN